MKKQIICWILALAKIGLNSIYFFIKLFSRQKNKITMLSKQSDQINLDFELLIEELQNKYKEIEIKVICKKIPKTLKKKIAYCFSIMKMLYHIATSKVCIIDGYSIPISILKHRKNLIVIQIWHAMGAIKKFGWQVIGKEEGSNKSIATVMQMHKNYTNVICTSNVTKKFYKESFQIAEEKILTLGIPKIDYLLGKAGKIEEKVEEIKKAYPHLKEGTTILYVPTFRKGKTIPIEALIKSTEEKGYHLIIRLHPLDETKIEEKYQINNNYKTIDLLKIADYVITDYSAIAFEAVTLEKPVFFYLYDIQEYEQTRGLNIDLKQEMPHSTFTKVEDMINIIESRSYYEEELKKFKEKYVETCDTQNTLRIVKYIVNLMGEK